VRRSCISGRWHRGPVDRDVYSNLIAALIELGRIDEAHRHASAWLSGAACRHRGNGVSWPCSKWSAAMHVGSVEMVRLQPASCKGHTVKPPAAYAGLDEFNRALESVVLGHDRLEMPPEDHPTWHHPKLRIGPDINNAEGGPVKELEGADARCAVDEYFANASE
jgi:hypothetical protein